MKGNGYRDLWFLLPVVLACLLAFYRFPLYQLDDHLTVIREIAETGRWPSPEQPGMRMANHPLFHHSLAALAWKAAAGPGSVIGLRPERAAQLLSLLYGLGTIFLAGLIVRRMVPLPSARRLAFLGMGTFVGFVMLSVTICNGMAFSFWGTAALLQAVGIMRDPEPPSSYRVLILGVFLGMAALMKMTAPVMMLAAGACLVSRRWYYRENWGTVGKATAGLFLVCLIFLIPSLVRFPRTLGMNPVELAHRERLNGLPSESDLFSLPLASMFRRPFQVEPYSSEMIGRAEGAFWTSLFLSHWNLPIHLPHPPNPYVTSAFTSLAVLMTLGGLCGMAVALLSLRGRPGYLPVLLWPLLYMAVWLVANLYFRQPGAHMRHLYFSVGSQAVFLALFFQAAFRRSPRLRTALWVMVGLQVILFWLMVFGGPFYYFYSPWPNLIGP